MKNMIKILVLAVAMITFNVSTYAQKSERQRMTREQLAEAQAHFIADEMAMDDTTAKQFVETFCQFQKDIWALGPRPKRDASHHSQKILDLRKRYYLKYSKFLTPKQIERVYELERKMMNRLFHRSQNKENRK